MDKEQFQSLSKYQELKLLLLFGSQARGDESETSDWDFGFIGEPGFDSLAFYNDLVLLIGTDQIDLVNLSCTSGLLRYRAARDGVILLERKGEFEKFWFEAVDFWCEMGPIIQKEYDDILESLG